MSATTRAGRVPAPIAEVVPAFREYTIDVRGLSFWTAQARGDVARRFLAAHAPGGTDDLATLSVEQVHDFFRSEAQRLTTMSMGPVLDSMRSFLRFLFAAEVHEHDLSGGASGGVTARWTGGGERGGSGAAGTWVRVRRRGRLARRAGARWR